MDLSIIIVSWNVKDKLKENLSVLYKSDGGFDFEIFVVDNASEDGTAEMVKQNFPRVRLITNGENLGFAKANNQAMKYSQGKYILLLNPDMKVYPDTLANMIGWMDNHTDASVAGCKLVDPKGKVIKHVRSFPGLLDQLAIVMKLPHFFPGVLSKYLRKDFDYANEAVVDSIRGSFFMIRRETANEIGLLDERYFIWFEEVDYCKRVKNAGLKVMYTPVAECVDLVGASFLKVKTGKKQRYFRDSMLKYFKKWHPGWQYKILKFAWPIGAFFAVMAEAFNYKGKANT